MFKINPTLQTIEAGEQDVVDLYRVRLSEATAIPAEIRGCRPKASSLVQRYGGCRCSRSMSHCVESYTKKALYAIRIRKAHAAMISYEGTVAGSGQIHGIVMAVKMESIISELQQSTQEFIVALYGQSTPRRDAENLSRERGTCQTWSCRHLVKPGGNCRKGAARSCRVDALTAAVTTHDEAEENEKAVKTGVSGKLDNEREKILAEKAEAERRASAEAETARHALKKAESNVLNVRSCCSKKAEAEKRAALLEEAARLALERADAETWLSGRESWQRKTLAEKRADEQARTARLLPGKKLC